MSESARGPERGDATAAGVSGGARRRAATAALLLLLPGVALAALYARALDYDYAWTDTSAIAGRSMLRPPGEIALAFREPLHRIAHRGGAARQSYYRPLQTAALSWVDDRFGSTPRSFRSAGLAIGALCFGTFSLFAWMLLGSPAAALFAALFVACHPVGIESFVWIAGGSGALCALFAIAALALALSSATAGRAATAGALGLLSLIALAAALLSKERAATEPLLLLAVFVCIASGRAASLRRARATGLVAAHALLVAVYWFGWRPVVLGAPAVLPPIGGSGVRQIASALANWPANLAWLFAPLHSSTSDVIRVVESAADPRAWLGAGLALGSAGVCWLCLRGGRPITALGLAWIWIAYAPTAGLLPMLHANGERYLFLSAFGASLIAADLLAALARRVGPGASVVLAAALLAFLAARTSARIPEWESNLGLFQHEIARDPAYREGYFLVASELFERGRFEEADAHLTRLQAQGPEFAGTASYANPLTVNELVCANHLALRRYDEILVFARQLRRSHPGVARAAPVRTCIGQAHNGLGHTRQALEIFRSVAGELGTGTPPALYLMIARGHLRLGEAEQARAWLARARKAAGPDPVLRRKIRELGKRIPPAAS
jgi:tetratricopeptide (TPR) repeat protein